MIDRLRALSLIAASPNGCTTTALMAQGVPPRVIADLVDRGLAISSAKMVDTGARPIEVTRLRITQHGRKALT
jgi:hypothetical protein